MCGFLYPCKDNWMNHQDKKDNAENTKYYSAFLQHILF